VHTNSECAIKGIVSRDGVATEAIYVYCSLGLNIAPRISFTLVNLRIKNIRGFKQAVSRCERQGLDFTLLLNSTFKFLTLCWQIPMCHPRIVTMKMVILLIATGLNSPHGSH
jgi:hypothetical protein